MLSLKNLASIYESNEKIMTDNYAPVVLFTHARYDSAVRVMESLKNCQEFSDTPVYVYLDFPQKESYVPENLRLKKYFENIQHSNLTLNCRSSNYGLAKNIVSGVSEILASHEKIIVLEDDIEVSETFLSYMNAALNYYEKEERISSIHGYVYPGCETGKPEFQYGADCWGWATWKSRWNKDIFQIENIQRLCRQAERKKLLFDYFMGFPYQKLLFAQVKNQQLKSWAIVWHAYNFVERKLCLYPPKSLIANIGLDNSGENCSEVIYKTDAHPVVFSPAKSLRLSRKSYALFVIFFWRRRLNVIFSRLKRLVW